MPMADYQNFDACVSSYMNKVNKRTGKKYDKETASKICGAIKQKVEGKDFTFDDFSESIIVQSDSFEFKSEDGNHYVDFYLTTDDIDAVNDIVTKDCQDDMVKQLVGQEIQIKMGIEHDVIIKGDKRLVPHAKIIEAKRINEEGKSKIKATAMMNKFHPDFNSVWGSIQNGFLDATSIEYKPIDYSFKNIAGKTIRMLNKLILGGVTFTGRAINKAAKITDFYVKSQEVYDTFEDIKREVEECNGTCEIKSDDMENCKACNGTGKIKKEIIKSEVKIMSEEVKEEIKTEQKIEVKSEEVETKSEEMVTVSKKEYDELKSFVEEKKAKEHDMKLAEEIKSMIKEALKEIQPEVKSLTEQKDKFEEKSEDKKEYDIKSQLMRKYNK